MIVDLSFLNIGNVWPPPVEVKRLERYKQNRMLFEGKHSEIYKEQFKRIERVIGNFENIISYPVIINFQKILSLKMADLLLGETPKALYPGKQDSINSILEYTGIFNKAYEVAIDVSRYGTGIFIVYNDENGKGIVDITQPSCWFPVVSQSNIKKIHYHVLAWVNTRREGDSEKKYLNVQIHGKGYYILREYFLEEGYISGISKKDILVEMGFDDFAVIPIHNILTTDRVYGIDDYGDIDSIISEIEVRIAQISSILDKHSSPTMTGPSSALTDDGRGGYILKTGNYVINDSFYDGNSSDVKYITWDAHLESNFKQIERLVDFLYLISETGATLLDSQKDAGRAESGTALRLRMMSPLAKVNRIRMKFDPAIRKALALASLQGWGKLNAEDINIIWNDGLPSDPKEEAEIMQIRMAGKATISRKEAIKRLDSLDDAHAEVIFKDILSEEI